MNRPFCAFGALLAFLVLAMFAVSSSSRSTTVCSTRLGDRSAWTRAELHRAAAAGADVPECDGGDYESDVLAGDGASQTSQPATSNGSRASTTRMVPARITMAENQRAMWPSPLVLDCRSHSDRTYDRLIYGDVDEDAALAAPIKPRLSDDPKSPDSDWLTLFQSLVAPQRISVPSLQAGAALRLPLIRPTGQSLTWLRLAVISTRAWLVHQISQLVQEWNELSWRVAAPIKGWLSWDDYAELIDRATAGPVATSDATGTSDAGRSVRFGGWLRHSAASSLHQVGSLLQAISFELDRADVGPSNSRGSTAAR